LYGKYENLDYKELKLKYGRKEEENKLDS